MSADYPPSMSLPPIDRVPRHPVPQSRLGPRQRGTHTEPNALRGFVDTGARPWAGEPVPLSPATTGVLWILLGINLPVAGWLIAVRTGAAPCSGTPCAIATLGGHAGWLLILSVFCVVALAGSALVTRGLSRANAPQLALITVGAVGGVVAALGVFALLITVAVSMVIVGIVLLLIVDRS
jgi:hypothetical protein